MSMGRKVSKKLAFAHCFNFAVSLNEFLLTKMSAACKTYLIYTTYSYYNVDILD